MRSSSDRSIGLTRARRIGVVAAAVAIIAVANAASGAEVGKPAPAFALRTESGDTVTLAGLRGKVVYVDFWASWCGPCRRSFPWMNEVQQRYGAEGFAIVAINVDKQHTDAQRFLQAVPARFTVVYDAAGSTPLAYSVEGMPSSFLIDAQGTVVGVEQGFRDDKKSDIEQHIRSLLANR
jgi:cytochrome c biogenesis protein CcmG, thiol:disulfide interchange protein DsbE